MSARGTFGDSSRFLPLGWTDRVGELVAHEQPDVDELVAALAELPSEGWALEHRVAPLELEYGRPHRLKVFEVAGREVFACIHGPGVLEVGLIPTSSASSWVAPKRIELHDFHEAWEEVVQMMPLPQLYSDTVILAIITRRVDGGPMTKLYRAVVDIARDGLRVIPALEAHQFDDSQIWARPLPSQLEPLARFPIESRDTLDPACVDEFTRALPEGGLLEGEQPVCSVIHAGRWHVATTFDRLLDASVGTVHGNIELPGRPYSIDVLAREGQPAEVVLVTEDAELLAITDKVVRVADCARDSLVSTTRTGELVLASSVLVSIVGWCEVEHWRRRLVDALGRSLGADWTAWEDWLGDASRSRYFVPTGVGLWLEFVASRGAVTLGLLEDSTDSIAEWASQELAAPLGREVASHALRWPATGPHWGFLWSIYEKAGHAFRREIDAIVRPEIGHEDLRDRANRSSFAVVDDESAELGERVQAALEISISPYLSCRTSWLGQLVGSDPLRGIATDDVGRRIVLLAREACRVGEGPPLVSCSAPPRFVRGALIGYENQIHDANSEWPSDMLRSGRCVDALARASPACVVLVRQGLRGTLRVLEDATWRSVTLSVPAACSMDMHPDAASVVVVGERTLALHWLSLREVGMSGQVGLPDLPTCVRFSVDGRQVFVGTDVGLVLCFRWDQGCRELLWSYCTRGHVREIDVSAARVLVVSPGEEVTVLDREGQRVWRLRRRRLCTAAWTADGGIVLGLRGGQLTELRPGDPDKAEFVRDHWEKLPPGRQLAAKLVVGRLEPRDLDALDRDARLVLVRGLACERPSELAWSRLSARDLAAVARSIPGRRDVWQRAFEAARSYQVNAGHGPGGVAAKATAVIECLRRLPSLKVDRAYVVRRLAEVPAEIWQSRSKPWLAVVAADLLLRDGVDWRRVLDDGAALPFEVVQAAARLAPGRAGPCHALALAAQVGRDDERLDAALRAVALALTDHRDDLGHVLRMLAELAAKPTLEVGWDELADAIGYARMMVGGGGRPVVGLVSAFTAATPSEVPSHASPLDNQRVWLQQMLGHGVRIRVEDVPAAWQTLLVAWARRLQDRIHAAGQRRLQQVLSTTRVRVELEFDGTSRFVLALEPEGSLPLDEVELRIELAADGLAPTVYPHRLARLAPTDPTFHVSLELGITYQRHVEVTIEVYAQGELHDRMRTRVAIRPVDAGEDAMLPQLPSLLRSTCERIQAWRGELVVVARLPDLEFVAGSLGLPVVPDVVGTDWREGLERGVLFPALARAHARLADSQAEPSNETRVWLLPPGLGERLALVLGVPLIRATRLDALAARHELIAWLRTKHVAYEAAQSLLNRTAGDLRACFGHVAGLDVDTVLVEALRDDLGGLGPLATAALLGARPDTEPSPLVQALARVVPMAPHREALARLGLLDERGDAGEFVLAAERAAGGPEGLLARLAGPQGFWSELAFDRLQAMGYATLRLIDPRLDDRKARALVALGRLWAGRGGTAAMQQFAGAIAHDSPFSVGARPMVGTRGDHAEKIGDHTLAFISMDGELPTLEPPSIAFGPGVDRVAEQAGVQRVSERALRQILAAQNWWQAMLATVRAQQSLFDVNPFTSHGALRPGHPLFVGREAIRRDFRLNVERRHFLLLGSRRIGKTSLMNQLYHEAHRSKRLTPMWVEGQGVHHGTSLPPLAIGPTHAEALVRAPGQGWLDHLREQVRAIKQAERVPVLFLNEIDGLARHDPAFLNALRGELENGLRMVAVGYSGLARETRNPEGFLYHLASDAQGQPAYNLSVLAPTACRELVDQLKTALGFWWESDDAEQLGREELVKRSLGIPWVLQDLCSRLVGRLVAERRGVIYLDDARRVVADAPSLLDHLHAIEFERTLPDWSLPLSPARVRLLIRFILLILARRLYFVASPPAEFDQLVGQPPGRFAFRPVDADRILRGAVHELPFMASERERIEAWIAKIDLGELLLGLSLTLLLEANFEDGDEVFAFQGHIYPLELWREHRRGGRFIDDRILDLTLELLGHD